MVETAKKPVFVWLLVCIAALLLMIMLGGITRVTGSGLSIVEWNPLLGVIPPLTTQAWEAAFQAYQRYGEYKMIHPDMQLSEFKWIYGIEYFHRLWGRLIGVIILLPLLYFAKKRLLSRKLVWGILGLLALGGAQGFVGWVMVKSGLGQDPFVSPFRLTIHLLLALFVLLGFVWIAHRAAKPHITRGRLVKNPYAWLLVFAWLVVGYGGLVAGHKAWLIYNTFPLMGGEWVPGEIFDLVPLWKNFFYNPVTVQGMHRWLATCLSTLIACFVLWRWGTCRASCWEKMTLLAVGAQFTMGVLTLIHHVPPTLAVLHQLGGIILCICLAGAIFSYSPCDRN